MDVREITSAELTYASFRELHEVPAVPLVIRGGASTWPCTSQWSVASLRDRFADKVIRRPGKPPIEVGPHLDLILSSAHTTPATEPPPYLLRNIWLSDHFHELLKDVRVPEFVKDNWFDKLAVRLACDRHWFNWMEFFVCGVGTRFPVIHQDILGTHGWLAQVAGRKRYWVWHPQAVPGRGAIAPGEKEIVGFGRGDWNKVEPATDLRGAFPDDEPAVVTLSPGDVIFIPSNWWHTVETLEPSINLGGNWFNSTNWQQVQVAALKRPDTPRAFRNRAYLYALGYFYLYEHRGN